VNVVSVLPELKNAFVIVHPWPDPARTIPRRFSDDNNIFNDSPRGHIRVDRRASTADWIGLTKPGEVDTLNYIALKALIVESVIALNKNDIRGRVDRN
jgi:hypothetical protein